MPLIFRHIQDSDIELILQYIHELHNLTHVKFIEKQSRNHISKKTFKYLKTHPDSGQIYVFDCDNEVIGYAIVINSWSNEYGGIILNIDEIFVDEKYRNQRVATSFLEYLSREFQETAMGIELEALPSNHELMNFYDKCGFKKSEYALLYRPIE